MSTLSTLITGGNHKKRLNKIESFQQNLPLPPQVIDGHQQPITIKTIRQFQKDINLSTELNQLQRHFILEAQNLTLPAQHALLKTLEEPPPRTQIILTADQPSSLLDTILSRCHHLPLSSRKSTHTKLAKDLLKNITSNNYAQLINLAAKTDAKTAQKQLHSLLLFLKQNLHSKPTKARLVAIKSTTQALGNLKTNINKQLTLEHLFFTLKRLSHRWISRSF